MILLFADGIKEKTQPAIYNTPIEALDFTELQRDVSDNVLSYIKIYLTNLRSRFSRHYRNQIIREYKGQLPPEEALRSAGRHGCAMSTMGSRILEPLRRNYTAKNSITSVENYEKKVILYSGTSEDVGAIMHVLTDVYALFRYGRGISYNTIQPIEGHAMLNTAQLLSYGKYAKAFWIKITSNTGDSHAIAFYTCGGNDYVFDNEYGPITFPWHRLFEGIKANPSKGLKIGFVNTSYVDCVSIDYNTFPVLYDIVPGPAHGAPSTLRMAVICQDGSLKLVKMEYAPGIIWTVTEMIVFDSDIPTAHREAPPSAIMFPRLKQKGASRRRGTHNRSKRRTREH
jgi:hypothetical protein